MPLWQISAFLLVLFVTYSNWGCVSFSMSVQDVHLFVLLDFGVSAFHFSHPLSQICRILLPSYVSSVCLGEVYDRIRLFPPLYWILPSQFASQTVVGNLASMLTILIL